jgi:hypothetical protein
MHTPERIQPAPLKSPKTTFPKQIQYPVHKPIELVKCEEEIIESHREIH